MNKFVSDRNIIPNFGPIGYITYKRSYSRRLDENDPNSDTEEFHDTVDRVINACRDQLNVGFTAQEEKELSEIFLNFKASVAGRFMWQLGTETVNKLGLTSLQNCAGVVIDHPIRPFTWAFEMLMLGSGVGFNIQKKYVDKLPLLKSKVEIRRLDTKDADYIVPDTREGWIKLLGKVLKAHFYSGKGFTYSTQLIRAKGEPIGSFGGTASGPEELCWGINKIHEILNNNSGQKLKPIDCLDIMNIIGHVVVSGNVRRSAQLSIGDHDDIEFLKAKRWDLGSIPNWRSMSNNSVVCEDTKDLPSEFWDTYKQGEPYGLINIKLSREIGRIGETQYPDKNAVVYNPCVSGDTEILTNKGYVQIKDLVDVETTIWNGFDWSTVTPKITGHNQPMLKIKLSNFRELDCTDYHKWHVKRGIIKAIDLKIGDEIIDYTLPNQASPLQSQQTIISIQRIENEELVYCFDEPKNHTGIFNGIITGQCAEQPLNNYETCCLGMIYLPNISTYKEFIRCLELLYRICKHSLALHCNLEETQDIVNSLMRIGIGLPGYLQSTEEQKSWCSDAYKWLREYDKQYSKEHGFPESIKLTTSKPDGTNALLPGVTPGCLVNPAGPYYIRRIRIASDSPLIEVCRQNGYFIEPQRNFDKSIDKNTMVVEFPCCVPESTPIAGNFSWKEQIEVIKRVQREWSDNSVSCTITYNIEDLEDIKKYLADNFTNNFKTLSFLLYHGHGFDQAPYETITKEMYEEMISKTSPIQSIASIDENSISGVDECANGSCPIK